MRTLILTRKRQGAGQETFFQLPKPHWSLISIFTFCNIVPKSRPPRAPLCFSRFHSQRFRAVQSPQTMTGYPPKRLVEWTDFSSKSPNLISFPAQLEGGNNISRIRALQELNGSNKAVKMEDHLICTVHDLNLSFLR